MTQLKAAGSKKIVVLEETTDNLYSLQFILRSLGYDAVALTAREDLLDHLAGMHAEVVLIDMLLPGDVSLSLIRLIRKTVGAGVRILAISADAVPHPEDEIKAAGADAVLMKPYNVSELQAELG
ncbi:MAG: response regulator [Acidobacteriota bacterium]|jgi:CheY-like chemotaxis protein